jgi:hypothetical protein
MRPPNLESANTMSVSIIIRDRLDNLRAAAQKLEALNKLPGNNPHWRRKVALNPYQILLLEADETRGVAAWRFLYNNCLFKLCFNHTLQGSSFRFDFCLDFFDVRSTS